MIETVDIGRLEIVSGGLDHPQVAELLRVHLSHARAESPPCSVHALDLSALRSPHIQFWSAWSRDLLLGVGALQQLDERHGEIKSMHTAAAARGCGVGSEMLRHIIGVARVRGYSRLSLETGSMAYFHPARRLYRRHGFAECPPFGSYKLDPNSVFMKLDLAPA